MAETMRAAVYRGPRDIKIEEDQPPVQQPAAESEERLESKVIAEASVPDSDVKKKIEQMEKMIEELKQSTMQQRPVSAFNYRRPGFRGHL